MSGALEHLFARYVSGNISVPASVLVDAHLQINPRNRQFVRSLEHVAGLALEEAAPSGLKNADSMFDAILASNAPRTEPVPVYAIGGDNGYVDHSRSGLPTPIASYLRLGIDDVPWRKIIPGLWEYEFEDDGQHVSLIRVRAGQKLPAHTHEGQELTLVLQGSFHDKIGNFRAGDIAIADDTVDHQPIAGEEEDCICFSVVDNPVRLTGPIGRLISPFLRH